MKLDDISSQLRHRITLEQPVMTAADGGQFEVEWESIGQAWAMIDPIPNRSVGSESLFSEQQVTSASHEITLRFRDDITTQMRVLFEGRHFNIRNLRNPRERKEFLVLLVEENVAT